MGIINSAVIKRESTEQGLTKIVQWDENSPKFCIRPMGEELIDEAREESKDPKRPMKTERRQGFRSVKVPNIDDDVFAKTLLKKTIAGWEEGTFELRHLAEIVDPTKFNIVMNGNGDEKIKFSEAALDELVPIAGLWFRDFIATEATEFADFHNQQKEEELGNSPSMPDGQPKRASE